MDVVLALIPSMFLGPASWRPVAGHLADDGWQVVVAVSNGAEVYTPDAVLHSLLDELPQDRRLVLVPHSNAGVFVPALTASRDVHGYVFVDARLPASHGRVGLSSPDTLKLVGGLVGDDGLVPPWTEWWGDADVASLFPNATVQQEVEREQRRFPLSFLTETLPVPAGWDDQPGAYLAFGDTYQVERQAAIERGWPVSTMTGDHLHMLRDPRQVATEIGTLLNAILPS